MRELTKAMKALSDETRLRMLNVLLDRECCVCEVIQTLDISQTRASRNLTILHDAGFLKMRKDGLWSFYSIDRMGLAEAFPGLLEAIQETLDKKQCAARDRERLKEARRVGLGGMRELTAT